jgi:hypothetical protein
VNLLRALQLGRYKIGYFIDSPMAKGLWLGLAALIVYGIFKGLQNRARMRPDAAAGATERPEER